MLYALTRGKVDMNSNDPQKLFSELLDIIKSLRGPAGCPWDRKQTHQSLVPYMLEEAHEAIAAIEDQQMDDLAGELGDVLLQVVLHAEIASEQMSNDRTEGFDISTVLSRICTKLIHRHPHVFGDVKVDGADQVLENWQKIKADEKKPDHQKNLLDSVPQGLPQLMVAQKYQDRAASVGFDWDNLADVFDKVKEEIEELAVEINRKDKGAIESELGDLFFALVNLSRFLGINAENSLRKANNKFRRRFTAVETSLGGADAMKGKSLEELDLEWDRIKNAERRSGIIH